MSNCNKDYCEIEPVMLPCPFCGELPEISEATIPIKHKPVSCYTVVCRQCNVSLGWEYNVTEALRRWNTRAKLD